ncbi:ABC transporter substrate-binding protein [Cryptosporangium aurantiacum]|uniref:ABC-type Fe3+-hydroxamate transport system, substrate-binding protein n=1 Tax=Cryptosporangium aurantiacum TaxID=134849 RepID=A0A1M7RN48_9ACTN|nr:ABC transporter substrate-binding protein [Cryptosporangium aurantiacum]SHN47528.1 ABC-type Fe3+-hydroxamate transport system, substrate-binding protein [Cryptosporangium aurantiacum]
MRNTRLSTLAAIGTAVALALTGCGDDSADGADSAGEPSAATTRTVEDTFTGTVTGVPTKPKRIVALWRTGSELADIGVVPVGALQDEFLAEELGADVYAKVSKVPTVGSFEGVDVEKVIAVKPDLILGMDNGGLTIDYKELSQVAPTVILKIAEPTDVWANYEKIADLAGVSTDFSEQKKDLDAALKKVADAYGSKVGSLKVTALGSFDGAAISVDTSKSLTYQRIDAAGFGYNAKYTANPERYVAELALENIPDLADQDIIFYDTDLNGKPLNSVQKILDEPAFKRLPAAQKGHVYPLTSGNIYTFEAGLAQARDLEAAAKDYTS